MNVIQQHARFLVRWTETPFLAFCRGSNTPKEPTLYPLFTSLCTGELNAIRKQNAFSAVRSTEGRVVGICWAKLKPKGPKGSPCGVSVVGALILQSWDTMSLIKADLSSVCVRARAYLEASNTPREPTRYPLFTSLCTGELNAIRKQRCFLCSPFYGRACRWHMLGEIKT